MHTVSHVLPVARFKSGASNLAPRISSGQSHVFQVVSKVSCLESYYLNRVAQYSSHAPSVTQLKSYASNHISSDEAKVASCIAKVVLLEDRTS